MLFISAKDNKVTPGVAELHLGKAEDITIVLTDGQEFYVSGVGYISSSYGLR